MATNGIRAGKSFKQQYKDYQSQGRWLDNKIAKLERTVKNQPNNKMAATRLNQILKDGATRPKVVNGDDECKGRSTILGYIKNKVPPKSHKIQYSKIWSISTNYSKWFLPSAPKRSKHLDVSGSVGAIWERLK